MRSLIVFVAILNCWSVFGQDTIDDTSPNGVAESAELVFVLPRDRGYTVRNTVYLELAGSGGFGSLNYEWNFKSTEQFRWMLRTGISGTYIDKNNGAALIFPVMVHGIYGKKHGLDVGIGQTLSVTTRGGFFLRAPVSVGYRFEPEGKRMFYRIAYTPLVSYLVDFQWEHWAGVSIGFKLKPRYRM